MPDMRKLKICGNHRESDIKVLLPFMEHIDHVGFIFTPQSKRRASVTRTAGWLNKYPILAEKAVAVFLNQEVADIVKVLLGTGISIVQLHGQETVEQIEQLREMYECYFPPQKLEEKDSQNASGIDGKKVGDGRSKALLLAEKAVTERTRIHHGENQSEKRDIQRRLRVWKVLHVEGEYPLSRDAQADFAEAQNVWGQAMVKKLEKQIEVYSHAVDAFLLDTQIKGQLGGTGKSFDWTVLPQLAARLNQLSNTRPLWVAGGVNTENIAELLRMGFIAGVDLASGTETNGQKDRDKLQKLITEVKSYECQ